MPFPFERLNARTGVGTHQVTVGNQARSFLSGLIVLLLITLPYSVEGNAPHQKGAAATSQTDDPYLICEKGKRQSPINIRSATHSSGNHDLIFRYKPSNVHIVHDGHSFKSIQESNSMVLLDGQPYYLIQFHWHDPSEHHIEGVAYSMEMHLVHKDSDGRILVIGVLMKEGTENVALAEAGEWVKQQLGHRFPQQGDELSGSLVFDLRQILPADRNHFYSYQGSLTTAPCTEGVRWIVLKEPIEISSEQMHRFIRAYGPTARSVQPLNKRDVETQ